MTLVYVGMSGGVDSSVSAYLLQQQGYQVEGVFMQNWDEEGEDPFCPAQHDLADARAVCAQLGIPLHTVSFAKAYWDHVFEHFLNEYAAGRTPNPDILCNREIKFSAFLDYAIARGAEYIATGHYARILNDSGSYQLVQGIDPQKDQSYFLYTLQQKPLSHSLFPIGSFFKSQVRDLARKMGLVTHAKKDSVGICFIGERNFRNFLQEYLLARPGVIETDHGESIGQHQGLMFYTLGQRQGLGIGGRRHAENSPWYVLDKDITRNALVVGQGHDHPLLLSTALECQQLSWVAEKPPNLTDLCLTAKTRYRQAAVSCRVFRQEIDTYRVEFDLPVWGVTPGQSVVFYAGAVCLGGGVISQRFQ